MPQNTTAMTPMRSTFCSANAPARDTAGTGSTFALSPLERNASRPTDNSRQAPRKPRNHGPIELTAYSLALGLYLEGRRRPLPAAHLAKVILASVVLLGVAALLETFVSV